MIKTLNKGRILVVDDEVITLKITRKFLNSSGYDVDIAEGTTEAVNILKDSRYDLVIIDITMPTLTGFDLIQIMQSFNIETPVIFLSNNDNASVIEEAYKRGGRQFVSKEKEFNDLPQIIRDILDKPSPN